MPWARIARWFLIVVAALIALVAAALLFLDTSAGHRLIANRLAGYTTASGLRFSVGRIEGSVYGRMVLRDVRVRDPAGVFLTSPEIDVDWRPFAYLHGLVDLHDVSSEQIRLLRLPALKPTPTKANAPILPNIDLNLDRLHVGRLVLAPAVTGRRHAITLDGHAKIADRRAQIAMRMTALRAAGVAGGDVLIARIDAVPAANRLLFDVKLDAPAGGLVDSAFHFGKPLRVSVSGHGDWTAWRGSAKADLGSARIVDLALAEHSGTVKLSGVLRPSLVASGPAARLTEPAITVSATAQLNKRRVNLVADARSDALALSAHGLVDLGESRLGGFHLDARLLTPGSIASNLSGRDVALAAVLDGPFAHPTIAYRATASRLAFGTTGVDGLVAEGSATIDANRVRIPIHAVARRVTGLSASFGGLLTNLRVDGNFAYAGGKLVSDDLRLRSNRIDATAVVIADITSGVYTGAIKGRVNRYQVDGIGQVALVTNAHLTSTAKGFALQGQVRITTQRIDNASVASTLGGQAVITADVGYGAGGATIRNLRLSAPDLRIASGQGSYGSNGQISFHATGRSTQYGPLELTVTGTVAKPNVRLKAAHPTIGIPLSNVEAEVEGTGAGYRVHATGGSPYGPFAIDLTLRSGSQGGLDIAKAHFAGVDLAGHLVRTAAGPYSGTLTLSGNGLGGSIRLSAAGRIQRVEASVDAHGARVPASPPITIARGTLHATALLYPGKPTVDADVQLVNLAQGNVLVRTARARLRYQRGTGTLALVADGRSKVPFSIAAQASLTPTLIRANIRGSINGIDLHLAAPAVVDRAGKEWRLRPTTILLPKGQVQLAGTLDAVSQLSVTLRDVDLAVADALVPGFGLGGRASGHIAATLGKGASLPTVEARIDIAGFTRTGAEVVSAPVDVALLGRLDSSHGSLDALIRSGSTIIGRLQARLGPIPAGGGISQRLSAAPLAGGLRYSGPGEILWTLTGIAGQDVTGPIAVAADFGGRLGKPTLVGVLRGDRLTYTNTAYGTKITDIAIAGRFTQSRLNLTKLTGRAGDGTIAASGMISLDAASGFPINLQVTFDNARLASSDDLSATATGTLAVTHDKSGGLIRGTLRIPKARYQIVRQRSAEVPELTGVHRKNAPPEPPPPPSLPSDWKLDLRVQAPNNLYISGMGLEAEWSANLRVSGSTNQPSVVGTLKVVRGTYSFAGHSFDLDRGTITFQGGELNPALDISASTTVDTISAVIDVSGTAQKPQISFTSTPTLPQDEVLSRLLFGQSVTSLSPLQAIQLAAAVNSLRGSGGGLNPLGKLRSALGFDRLRILGADQTTGRGTAIGIGKHIGKNLYVEVITDARGFTATQFEIALSKTLRILSQTSSFGSSNVTLRYTKDY